jgi:acetylglutamate/LysW-gamma-L-alpha-aminoadipate kinase
MNIVVKIGGKLIPDALEPIADNLKVLQEKKFDIIVVHGGGNEVTKIAEKLGKKAKFVTSVSGFRSRYTDKEMALIFEMIMAGKINKEIVRVFQRKGINAIGLAGPDGCLIKAKRKKAIRIIEKGKKIVLRGDYTGKIMAINKSLLMLLVKEGYVPIVAPVAIGSEYETLNIDGDRAAAYIAGAMGANVLIFLTDVGGVILKGGLVKKLKGKEEIEEAMKLANYGMKRKIFASLEALAMGVSKTIIASGFKENPILSALESKDCTVLES